MCECLENQLWNKNALKHYTHINQLTDHFRGTNTCYHAKDNKFLNMTLNQQQFFWETVKPYYYFRPQCMLGKCEHKVCLYKKCL